eukprot:scaffold56259_cov64-Phaeocystis_antarctica.AAC.8
MFRRGTVARGVVGSNLSSHCKPPSPPPNPGFYSEPLRELLAGLDVRASARRRARCASRRGQARLPVSLLGRAIRGDRLLLGGSHRLLASRPCVEADRPDEELVHLHLHWLGRLLALLLRHLQPEPRQPARLVAAPHAFLALALLAAHRALLLHLHARHQHGVHHQLGVGVLHGRHRVVHKVLEDVVVHDLHPQLGREDLAGVARVAPEDEAQEAEHHQDGRHEHRDPREDLGAHRSRGAVDAHRRGAPPDAVAGTHADRVRRVGLEAHVDAVAPVGVAIDLLDAHAHGAGLGAGADRARVVEHAGGAVGEVELVLEHGLPVLIGGLHVDVDLGILGRVDHDLLLARGRRDLWCGGSRPQPCVERHG